MCLVWPVGLVAVVWCCDNDGGARHWRDGVPFSQNMYQVVATNACGHWNEGNGSKLSQWLC